MANVAGDIARETDTFDTGHGCTSESTLDTPTQTFVKVEGKLVARLTDPTVSHSHNPPLCPDHVEQVRGSSAVVKVCGLLVGRVDDACDEGKITSGALYVNIGT
tara:strand:- start:65 stop:376 length:312 start_codon:yes stop_codon:yes gene_type:complete